jgi:hypothetical protein
VKIGDKSFEAPADLAEALRGYHAAVNAHIETLSKGAKADKSADKGAGRDRGEDGKFLTRDKVAAKGEDDDSKGKKGEPYDYASKLLVEPEEAIKRLKAEIREEIASAYQGDQAAKEFWADVYKAEPGLRDFHHFVEAVLVREFKDLGGLPAKKAITELAARAKKALAAAAKGAGFKIPDDADADKATDTKKGEDNATFVEGITLSVGTKPKDKSSDGTKIYRSISEQLAARAEARRQAQHRRSPS